MSRSCATNEQDSSSVEPNIETLESLWAAHPLRTPRNRAFRLLRESPTREGFQGHFFRVGMEPGCEFSARGYFKRERLSLPGPLFGKLPLLSAKAIELVSDSLVGIGQGSLPALVAVLAASGADTLRFRYYRTMPGLEPDSLLAAFRALGYRTAIHPTSDLLRCDVRAEETALPSFRLGKKARYNERRGAKQLEATHGGLRFERFDGEADLDRFFRVVSDLGQLSWQGRGGFRTISDVPLWRELCAEEASAGRFLSYALFCGDRPAAFQFGTLHGDVYHYENIGFDSALAAYSPGKILRTFALDELYATQASFVDFGIGDRDYKRQWASVPLPTFEMSVYLFTIPGRCAWRLARFSAFLRKALGKSS